MIHGSTPRQRKYQACLQEAKEKADEEEIGRRRVLTLDEKRESMKSKLLKVSTSTIQKKENWGIWREQE